MLLSIHDEYQASLFQTMPKKRETDKVFVRGCGAHPNKRTCGNTAGMGISSELQANGFTS